MPAGNFSPDAAPARVRRAKIICTIGPACDSEACIRDLMHLGMDVARLNFSHGTHAEHARRIKRLRRVARRLKRTICILQDLQGPKIRTGRLKSGEPVMLEAGARLTITPREVAGTAALIATDFAGLAREVEPGARVLLSDGRIELKVIAMRGADVECEVLNGGLLAEQQGINLPGAAVSIPALTDKDKDDLKFGLQHGVDAVALSFVRSADDIRMAKDLMREYGKSVPIVAKLEKPQAIERLEEILETSDGVMIARGDLGVELPPEQVPIIQKRVIQRASLWRKPVITATQMLESMTQNPRPTRAEASDVANAIFDGTDVVMLSAETASGQYPRETVAMMTRIILEAEASMAQLPQARRRRRENQTYSVAETICESVAHAAEELPMGAIAVFTESGNTARMLSKHRPKVCIYAFSRNLEVCNSMNALWGVHPIHKAQWNSAEEMVRTAEKELLPKEVLRKGDVLGLVAGTRLTSGATNFMRLHTVGESDRPRSNSRSRKK
ncbi:MAG: pyruvate kinase [Candidatus Koribacter versatilis]|nr:pyruvate kinase [Candidatus Koribacter versatilis]